MLDRRALPALAIAMPVVVAALASHLLATTAWIGAFELAVSIALAAATLATTAAVVLGRDRLAVAIPAAMLIANTGFLVGQLAGAVPTPLAPPDVRFVIVLGAGSAVAVAGLAMRRQWARWLALALGATAIGSGGLNAINLWAASGTPYSDVEWYQMMVRYEWTYLVTAIGGALIVLNLVASRAAFVASATWSRRDPVVRALRLTLIAACAAVPMLLVYAWVQPIVPATQPTALVLAAALTTGIALAVRGKLAGALLVVAGGLGLLAQTIATCAWAPDGSVARYYAVFWTPAAVLAIVSGALMIRPALRLVRRG